MRLSMGLRWGLLLLSGVLLSACLVGKDKTKNYTISLPSKLPTYASGHYINYAYESFYFSTNDSFSTNFTGGIGVTWAQSALTLPFTSNLRTPVLLHQVKETNVDGERYSMQYITQDGDGSILLNAIKGVSTSTSYWPDSDGTLNNSGEPDLINIFTSPIDTGLPGGSLVGIKQHTGGARDFKVMGSCDSSSCTQIAAFTFSDYTIDAIETISTPLGKFEAYRLHYSGIMTSQAVIPVSAYFDYRVSCGLPGSTSNVSFEGNVWIYPPIGPIKLQNLCSTIDGSTSKVINYNAQITSTNLPH